MPGSQSLARAVLAGAIAMAAAGVAIAVVRDDGVACEALQRGLGRRTATQSWDDIYTLQGDVTEWLRERAELEAEGCVLPVTDSTSTTTSASTTRQ